MLKNLCLVKNAEIERVCLEYKEIKMISTGGEEDNLF
jgi:hypothetical protein